MKYSIFGQSCAKQWKKGCWQRMIQRFKIDIMLFLMVGVIIVSLNYRSCRISFSIQSELTCSRLYLVIRVIWKDRAAIFSFSCSSFSRNYAYLQHSTANPTKLYISVGIRQDSIYYSKIYTKVAVFLNRFFLKWVYFISFLLKRDPYTGYCIIDSKSIPLQRYTRD